QLRHCRAADAGSQPPAVPGGRQNGTSGAGCMPAGCYSGA
ncbi:conjugal transfer protein TraI, partial [Staphylococcus sp. KY49P]|nr:conjugal transfer protein TraI [Staphylococcus sp. KY49P]